MKKIMSDREMVFVFDKEFTDERIMKYMEWLYNDFSILTIILNVSRKGWK